MKKNKTNLGLAGKKVSTHSPLNPSKTASPKQSVPDNLDQSEDGSGVEAGIAKTPAQTPVLTPQAHGGALLSGGKPGNKGGGRTPNEIRGTLRQIIDDFGVPWITDVLNAPRTAVCANCGANVEPPASDAVRARVADTVFRVSVGTQTEVDHKGHVTLHVDTS